MYYIQFKKIIKKVDHLEHGNAFFPYKTNGSAWKIHPGHLSMPSIINDALSCFVFETWQHEIQVSTCMVQQRASRCFLLSFRSKLLEAKKKVVTLFTKIMRISHHAATHTALKNF
jgi:hypothetical protein